MEGATALVDKHSRLPGPMTFEGNISDNWRQFFQEFELFIISTEMNKKSQKVQTATLLRCMGRQALQIYNTFSFDDDDAKFNLKTVCDKFQAYCEPKKNLFYERHFFNSRMQSADEPFDKFLTDLKSKAARCGYGDLTEDLIKDRIIAGIHCQELKSKLLKFNYDEVDLNKLVDECRAYEASRLQLKELDKTDSHEVNKVSTHKSTAQHPGKKLLCKFCGFDHPFKKELCPAFNKKCRNCNKTGHFEKKCLNRVPKSNSNVKKQNNDKYVKCVDSNANDFYVDKECKDNDENTYFIGNLFKNEIDLDNKCDVKIIFDNIEVFAEIDTGAAVNLLPMKIYELLIVKSKLYSTNAKLFGFNNNVVHPIGVTFLEVKINNHKHKLKFFVVNLNRCLLGRDTCINIGLIKLMNSINCKDEIFTEYKDVFQGIGCLENEVVLKLDENIKPVIDLPRKFPIALLDKVKLELNKMLKDNIIVKEDAATDWVSSLVIVNKSDKIRLCIDPRNLNKALKREIYPLPTIEEVATKLAGSEYFSVFDCKKGFWQLKLSEESSKLLTFNTPFGRYRFARMPFGISPAPEIYQRTMADIFKDIPNVQIIMDDILIHSKTKIEHDKIVKLVLERCRKVNLRLNPDKIRYQTDSVKYIGHIISKDGLKIDPDKVSAIRNLPQPTNKNELLKFMGMVNYLGKFINNLSDVNQPLRLLLKNDYEWYWGPDQDKCFNKLKELLSSAPVLSFYDLSKPVTLSVDASSYGLGACLLQEDHPVAFASRSLNDHEKLYSQIEKELLAIVFGITKFSNYVYGRIPTVESDHRPLETIFKKPISSAPPRLQRLLIKLQGYSLNVVYKPGKQLIIADYLSRTMSDSSDTCKLKVNSFEIEDNLSINHVIVDNIENNLLNEIKSEISIDPVMVMLKNFIQDKWPENKSCCPKDVLAYWTFKDDLSVVDNLILKENKILIPSKLRSKLLNNLHSAHLGINKTIRLARDMYFWPGFSNDIKSKVGSCEICNSFKNVQAKEPLIPTDVPDLPWQKLGCDIFELDGKQYLVLGDYYSRFIEVDFLENISSDKVITKLKAHFSRYGIPSVLITDNGSQFSSGEFQNFAKLYKFNHITSSPNYPQSNGFSESCVKVIKNLLIKAKYAGEDPYLSLLKLRNTPLSNIGSPALLLMGRRCNSGLPMSTELKQPIITPPSNVKDSHLKSKNDQEFYYNRNVKSLPSLNINDPVRFKAPGVSKHTPLRKANVINKDVTPRSYIIKDVYGNTFRRNRKDLYYDKSQLNNKASELHNQGPNLYNKSQAHFENELSRRQSGRIIKPPNKLNL